MHNDDRVVELMARKSGRGGRYLADVYDSSTGTYFAPDLDSLPEATRWAHEHGFAGKGMVCAVLDSGVVPHHPLIRRNVIHSVDFTGEGVEDLSGHGTIVTLLSILQNPDSKIVSVKVLDAEGRGTAQYLVDGFDWCVKNHERFNISSINLSAGVFHKKWGLWDCKGDCEVSRAAARAASENIMVVAAAGNDGPNEVACPQKLGLRGGITTVAAWDASAGRVADYSGPGTFLGQTGFPMKPLATNDTVPRCSFCSKPQDKVVILLAAPRGLFICDGCVALLADTLAAEDDGWRKAMIATLIKRGVSSDAQ